MGSSGEKYEAVDVMKGKKHVIPSCALWQFVYNIKLSPPVFNWERNAPFDFYSNINKLFYTNT